MNRRVFLSVAGASVAALAGCTGSTTEEPTPTPTEEPTPTPTPTEEPTPTMRGPRVGDDPPNDDTPGDGYPPAFETTPAPRSIDPASFETVSRNGQDVPLAPVEVTYYWYAHGEARFADARGSGQYESSHIYGAVSSPANSTEFDDPVETWPTDDRIVCYCGCPHHLSSIRAADLIARGYSEVYVIDEGFGEWVDRAYPVAGMDAMNRPPARTIEGRVAERFAGETAWAHHDASDQAEASEIGADGRYALDLHFWGVTDADEITVETPAYRTTAPLDELTSGVVTA